jgi:hypothetical protein
MKYSRTKRTKETAQLVRRHEVVPRRELTRHRYRVR